MTTDCQKFELRRRIDGLVYIFEHRIRDDGRSGFKRADGDYWIVQQPVFGWVAWDFDSETVMGRPWDVLPVDQENVPPEGVWVSRKARKSYVYDLVYT